MSNESKKVELVFTTMPQGIGKMLYTVADLLKEVCKSAYDTGVDDMNYNRDFEAWWKSEGTARVMRILTGVEGLRDFTDKEPTS